MTQSSKRANNQKRLPDWSGSRFLEKGGKEEGEISQRKPEGLPPVLATVAGISAIAQRRQIEKYEGDQHP